MRDRLGRNLISVAVFILTLSYWNHATAEPIRIGLVYDTGGRGDLSFCDASYAGAKKAAEQWQIELKEITPGQSTDIERVLRQLARLRYDLIIGVGFLFQDPMTRVAPDFPEVNFAVVDVEAKAPLLSGCCGNLLD